MMTAIGELECCGAIGYASGVASYPHDVLAYCHECGGVYVLEVVATDVPVLGLWQGDEEGEW